MQLFVLDICGFSLSDLACFCSGLFRPEEFAVLIKILLYRFSLSVISLVVFAHLAPTSLLGLACLGCWGRCSVDYCPYLIRHGKSSG